MKDVVLNTTALLLSTMSSANSESLWHIRKEYYPSERVKNAPRNLCIRNLVIGMYVGHKSISLENFY